VRRRTMRKYSTLLLVGAVSTQLLAGCTSSNQAASEVVPDKKNEMAAVETKKLDHYVDGTYTADSQKDDFGGIGKISITLKQDKIVNASFVGYEHGGKIKDAEYGKTNGKIENPVFYKKAQNAVKANATYAQQLIDVQRTEKVDAISGATVSYNQFMDAANKALDKAKG